MQLVDTHCHIQSSSRQSAAAGEAATRAHWKKAGYPLGAEIVNRAAAAGVTKLICVGCDLPDSRLAIDFSANNEGCYASIGIHPHEAKDYASDVAKRVDFTALACQPKVVAIGECGLDYFYEHSEPADQQSLLRFQIELALKHDLPLIFHVREGFDDFWPIFDSYAATGLVRGVLHSFTDSSENMRRAVKSGLYVGVNGIATFTKDVLQLEMYKSIPLSRLLLETDAPFLTPSPYRGTICEPYHTSVTAEFLANLRGNSLSKLAAATTQNAHRLFNL